MKKEIVAICKKDNRIVAVETKSFLKKDNKLEQEIDIINNIKNGDEYIIKDSEVNITYIDIEYTTPPCLRSHKDGIKNNNLGNLPVSKL